MDRNLILICVALSILLGVAIAASLVRRVATEGLAAHDLRLEIADTAWTRRSEPHEAPGGKEHISVPPPPLDEDTYPCSQCHEEDEEDYDTTRRKLDLAHGEIVLKHDEANRWCLDCHCALKRDFLHLADGRLVKFEESYKLCGQCHGPIFRDWKAGVHGKRTGFWNGKKRYLLCVHCHDPHSPAFKPIHPFPAPIPPDVIK